MAEHAGSCGPMNAPLLLLVAAALGASGSGPTPSPVDRSPQLSASLSRVAPGLRAEVLGDALSAWRCAQEGGDLRAAEHPDVLTVIDYSLPSSAKRMWVLDLSAERVLFHEHVAHGQATGGHHATSFSNVPGSHATSLGVFRTAETYVGKHGRSLRLDGLEPGVNDRARERAIVVHGADYASEAFIARHGRLGRSWGCPAVDDDVAQDVIDAVAGGSLLVAWYPDEDWRTSSEMLTCSP